MSKDAFDKIRQLQRAMNPLGDSFEKLSRAVAPAAMENFATVLSKAQLDPKILHLIQTIHVPEVKSLTSGSALAKQLESYRDLTDRITSVAGFVHALELVEVHRAETTEDDSLQLEDLEQRGQIVLPEDFDAEDLRALNLPESEQHRYGAVHFLNFRVVEAVLREPRMMREISPREFEELTAEILDRLGFVSITLTPRSADGGRDVVATKIVDGIPLVMYFECKRYGEDEHVGVGIIRSLLGVTLNDKVNVGVLVTTSRFTRGARELIASTAMLAGKEYDDVVGWLHEAWPGLVEGQP